MVDNQLFNNEIADPHKSLFLDIDIGSNMTYIDLVFSGDDSEYSCMGFIRCLENHS